MVDTLSLSPSHDLLVQNNHGVVGKMFYLYFCGKYFFILKKNMGDPIV